MYTTKFVESPAYFNYSFYSVKIFLIEWNNNTSIITRQLIWHAVPNSWEFFFLLYHKITVNMRFFRRISVSRLRLNRKFQFVILEICLGTLGCMYYSWMRTSSSISVESDVSNVGSLAAKFLFSLFIISFEENCWYSVDDLLI